MTPSEWTAIARNGLPARSGPRRRIAIVGAGMAGLVAAHELARAGHDPFILEAQHRVGGRILTLREPFAPGLYGEAGAMRIPRAHALTIAYAERFGLALQPFTLHNPQAYCHLAGRRHRWRDVDADPGLIAGEMSGAERASTCASRWAEAIRPLAAAVDATATPPGPAIVRRYDGFSTREFLEQQGWSEPAIELFGLLQNQEALMNACFLELLREEVGRFYEDLLRIEGGMDRLPHAFVAHVGRRIRYGARLTALEQSAENVTLHFDTGGGAHVRDGRLRDPHASVPGAETHRDARRRSRPASDARSASCATTPPQRSSSSSHAASGRTTTVSSAAGTVTDLPIRNVFYPDHGRETGRGVVLASYTWSEDAQRWGSLPPSERLAQALEDLGVHPSAGEGGGRGRRVEDVARRPLRWRRVRTVRAGAAVAAARARGRAEGRVHFAGEHASLAHAWIQGAIESGLRAALEVHVRATA